MQLEAIPGVGEKTAQALRELEDPVGVLESGDVAAIAAAPGVSEARAARVARGVIRYQHDDTDRVLATDRSKEVYRDAIRLIQDRTVTTYAKKRLETFYPSGAASRIEEAQSFAASAMEREPTPAVLEALEGVSPLVDPPTVRVRDRCVATADAEVYANAEAAVPELSVETVEHTRDIAELARSYTTVIVLDETFAGMDVDGDVRVRPDALDTPAETVPERLLAFFAANRDRLEAAAAVHEAAGTTPAADIEALHDALSRLDDDGTIGGDAELDRLTAAAADLDAAVSTAASVADDHLRSVIRERDVTIEGTDFLSLVEQGARVDSLLDRELADEYDTAVDAAREHLVETLSLEPEESELAARVFGDDPSFPIEHDETAVSRLQTELTAARDRRAARLKADLAADLGVNSGGKTSTLDLVALVVVLAQMGMPVPAEQATVERFNEIHYYAKSQGTLDAGAFEATLRDFGDLIEGADGRLVLVDELESITEPGASAKIIAGILEALCAQETTAVFVSHLAREIREAADEPLAVDGIEAVGLVDGELRVNRSPREGHLARSTPELIVEKLATERGGGFYTTLLEKF